MNNVLLNHCHPNSVLKIKDPIAIDFAGTANTISSDT